MLPKQALIYKSKMATTCTENGHKRTTKEAKYYKPKWRKHLHRMDKNREKNKHLIIKYKWLQCVQKFDTKTIRTSTAKKKRKGAIIFTEDGHKQTNKTKTKL